MARENKVEQALENVLFMARFKELAARLGRPAPMMWSGQARVALLDAKLNPGKQIEALGYAIDQWMGSNARQLLAAELSRLVCLVIDEEGRVADAEIAMPLWAQSLRASKAMAGGAARMGLAPERVMYAGIGSARGDGTEFGTWYEEGDDRRDYAVFPDMESGSEEWGALKAAASECLAKCLGEQVWSMVEQRARPVGVTLRVGGKTHHMAPKSHPMENVLYEMRNMMSGMGEKRLELSERDGQLVKLIESSVGTLGDDRPKSQWLAAACPGFSHQAIWSNAKADEWVAHAREIWERVEGGATPTKMEGAVLAAWLWLDKDSRSERMRAAVTAALGKVRWGMSHQEILWAVADDQAYRMATTNCDALSKKGAAATPAVVKGKTGGVFDLGKACEGLVDDMVEQALSVAMERQARWCEAMGYESAAGAVRSGNGMSLTCVSFEEESARVRSDRNGSSVGRVMAAIDMVCGAGQEHARGEWLGLMAGFGVDMKQWEAFSTTPQNDALVACAQALSEREWGKMDAPIWFAACALALLSDAREEPGHQLWSGMSGEAAWAEEIATAMGNEYWISCMEWLSAQRAGQLLRKLSGAGVDCIKQAQKLANDMASQTAPAVRYALAQALELDLETNRTPQFLHEGRAVGVEGGMSYEVRAMLHEDGFGGQMALAIEDSGLTPELLAGASERSVANAWVGLAKVFAKDHLGMGDAAWKAACAAAESEGMAIASVALQRASELSARARVEAKAKPYEPLGDLIQKAKERGRSISEALSAAEALRGSFGRVCGEFDPKGIHWEQYLSPMESGVSLSECLAGLAREEEAKRVKLPGLHAAVLERAGQVEADVLARELQDAKDWAGDRAGSFWSELPSKFGWSAVERASHEWHEQARQKKRKAAQWEPLGVEWADEATGLCAVELTTTDALVAEGKAMRHCVGSYSSACESGSSRIFSVQKGGRRLATLELKPKAGGQWGQSQLRGVCNAAPSKEASDAAWAMEERVNQELAKIREIGVGAAPKKNAIRWELPGFDAVGWVKKVDVFGVRSDRECVEINPEPIEAPSAGKMLLASIDAIYQSNKAQGKQ